jgi:hypothetical protein
MLLVTVLVFLVLRQVMPIASGLVGGASLNSFGLMSRSVASGMRGTGTGAKLGAQGVGFVWGRASGLIRSLRSRANSRPPRSVDEKDKAAALGGSWRDIGR